MKCKAKLARIRTFEIAVDSLIEFVDSYPLSKGRPKFILRRRCMPICTTELGFELTNELKRFLLHQRWGGCELRCSPSLPINEDERLSGLFMERQEAVMKAAGAIGLLPNSFPDLFRGEKFSPDDLDLAHCWRSALVRKAREENEENEARHPSSPAERLRTERENRVRRDAYDRIEVARQWFIRDWPSVRRELTREGGMDNAAEIIFTKGQQYDATSFIARIIRKAKKSIRIHDGYIDEKVLDLLTCKRKSVSVEILTKDKLISHAIKRLLLDFNKDYGSLAIRTATNFHDRFVLLDDCDFYHFGGSLKDAGTKVTRVSRIQKPSEIRRMREASRKEWAAAKPVV